MIDQTPKTDPTPPKPVKARRDFYSGLPWVYIEPEQARSLSMGKLGVVLWLIVAYFITAAVLKAYWVWDAGLGFGFIVLNAIWPLLTGLGLAFRVPWAVMMAIVSTALTVFMIVQGLGGPTDLILLAEMVINVAALFYLMDADRPNLIYRHRYRQYSVDRAADTDAD